MNGPTEIDPRLSFRDDKLNHDPECKAWLKSCESILKNELKGCSWSYSPGGAVMLFNPNFKIDNNHAKS